MGLRIRDSIGIVWRTHRNSYSLQTMMLPAGGCLTVVAVPSPNQQREDTCDSSSHFQCSFPFDSTLSA